MRKTLDWMTLAQTWVQEMGYTSNKCNRIWTRYNCWILDSIHILFVDLFVKNGTGLYAAHNYTPKGRIVGTHLNQLRAEFNDANTGNPKL